MSITRKKQHCITIATRESPLALWQANWVKKRLEEKHPHLSVNLLGMTTKADQWLETPLMQIGGKGLFVKELEEALLGGRADIAVHSMKDVPMVLPRGLCLPVMCEREDPRDVFVSNDYASIEALPNGANIGTSSLRRQSQLRAWRPELDVVNLRGNVNTRLQKLDQGEFQGIILASAGLKRLGLDDRIRSYLSLEQSLPAAGQGVLGIECRENDDEIVKYISFLNHIITERSVIAERSMCAKLGGGCQVPVASFAEVDQNKLVLRGLVASVDGRVVLRAEASGEMNASESIGMRVAEALLQQGAGDILKAISECD